ncbi:uncharacterized protein LOC144922733 [Branchiostoma floridae x Branchiostoma belcheri]
MSGARPKDYTRRSSNGSSHEDTAALCRHDNPELALEELAISSRDTQANQDGLQLSLAGQQPGTVQGISYTGHVEGKDNVLLQPGANCELTFNSPLIQHNVTNVTLYADGTTEVTRTYDDNEEAPQNQADPAAIDRLDDIASLANIPTRHPHTNVRRPKIPSTEQLDWLKRHLKRLYRTKLGEFQPLPWFDDLHLQLKDVYTNLQVVRKDRADRDLPLRRLGRGGTGKRSSNTGLIRIEQIFDLDMNGEIPSEDEEEEEIEKPKRIRIEGPPGIGKSIQCRKLACDWSSDSFQQFDFAFLLQMRYFSGDVKDAIFDQLLPEDTDIDREALWSYIRQATIQPKVLFILDGLDELKPQVRQTSDVIKLIQQRVLTDATVVITSRPHECTADLKGCPLHCNIRGFTKANSQEYIHKYFKGRPEFANSLCVRMARDTKLLELATNPLNTMLLCILWEDNDGSLPSTMTELFSNLVLCIVKRYCGKNDIAITGTTIPDSVYDQLKEMGRVAWEGLLCNEVNFDEADFKSRDLLRIGFLTRDRGASRIDGSFVWSFLHKTFQEYFAAVCLSTNTCIQQSCSGSVSTGTFEFIPHQLDLVEPHVRHVAVQSGPTFQDLVLKSFRNDHLHQVCLFLVGILKTHARTVFEYFCIHLQALRSSGTNDAQDEYKTLFRLCIQCLIESANGPDLVPVLFPCFPKALDVSSYFPGVYDNNWRLGLVLILNAECPGVTQVDINLSKHRMDKELAEAFIRSRFVSHLSITECDVISLDTEQDYVPLVNVLERAQSLRVFFARIVARTIAASDSEKYVRLLTALFDAMSRCKLLSSIILELYLDSDSKLAIRQTQGRECVSKLCLPVHLLASSNILTTIKLCIQGTSKRHTNDYDFFEADSDNDEGLNEFFDELDYYYYHRVDDQTFNESIRWLLCESKSIQSFNLQMMYRYTVFEHAKDLPTILAEVMSSAEALQHILLHFSFYHGRGEKSIQSRINVFGLIEALAQNGTLKTFELFIDDNVKTTNNSLPEKTFAGNGYTFVSVCSKMVLANSNKCPPRTCEDDCNQNMQSRRGSYAETDQDRLWPSISSVFQNNTVLHDLNLTFKYCLTDSPESVQIMADAIHALRANSTLRSVKLAVILYRVHNRINNVDEVFNALGNVVSTNTSLKCLHFRKADDPLKRTCRYSMMIYIDKAWHVTVSKPALAQLASATQRNTVLREFLVAGFSCKDEGAQELVDEMVSSARDDLSITFSIS